MRARRSARPIIETGTAMAILVLFDEPPEKVPGSLVSLVGSWVAVVVVEVVVTWDAVEVGIGLVVVDVVENSCEKVVEFPVLVDGFQVSEVELEVSLGIYVNPVMVNSVSMLVAGMLPGRNWSVDCVGSGATDGSGL
jgi:hypothetical protein